MSDDENPFEILRRQRKGGNSNAGERPLLPPQYLQIRGQGFQDFGEAPERQSSFSIRRGQRERELRAAAAEKRTSQNSEVQRREKEQLDRAIEASNQAAAAAEEAQVAEVMRLSEKEADLKRGRGSPPKNPPPKKQNEGVNDRAQFGGGGGPGGGGGGYNQRPLINEGNQCFFNAVLQIFASIDDWARAVESIDATALLGDKKFIEAFQKVITELKKRGTSKVVNEEAVACRKEFREISKQIESKFPKGRQSDASELFIYLIENLQSMHKMMDVSGIQFKYDTKTRVRVRGAKKPPPPLTQQEKMEQCYEIQHMIKTKEQFQEHFDRATPMMQNVLYASTKIIHEPIDQGTTEETAKPISEDDPVFSAETTTEFVLQLSPPVGDRETTINAMLKDHMFNFGGFDRHARSWYKFTFLTLPKYLVIRLKRETNVGERTFTSFARVEVPDEINLKEYVHPCSDDLRKETKYKLRAYAERPAGAALQSGHYIAIAKSEENNNWYLYNDEKPVQEYSFGRGRDNRERRAVMLVYKRI